MTNILKKSLGQNFLKDKGILKKIADFAQIEKEDTVVEVGPGEGTLTELLLERAKKVIAVEKDDRMVEFLTRPPRIRESVAGGKKNFIDNKLEVIAGDILNIDLKIFPKNYILVGNIPYYITGALFKKTLESKNPPKSLTFVVQKEVAERIMGSHFAKASRDKKESILSISIKVYGTPEFGGVIKAGSFNPKPKVDSAILSVRNISKVRFENVQEQDFFEILKAGFAHKRKLLIKNLISSPRNTPRATLCNLETILRIFKKCGISEKARAEDLKVEDWFAMTRELLISSEFLH
ncbi:MAG: ribosomal RNA small subunit methyltransferase A [Candidatus Zambryskibacteria bacterium RIFOXYC1_FULL_39_10]|uniref:Ribosomal RNA small subunit methyltransferase A n=1 Tax=Candidatus Zambryskibacteria bacterium RIFOXYC1_FULL_39_10 TaxID=1802779 RepID=A0A1G2V037_9BACT|nr:MAG: ribosomal RNA small subunit methyltransferase A [Candidatus Zambryskibacteria bacterium RIFOXYD1_FULL_39_35]OHB14971.1 MAG: ribosomal RNA small subunit methyltransferase A [Candidatus Zambryskibacteria bacterium RIFOXYC1_FULL_39_10]